MGLCSKYHGESRVNPSSSTTDSSKTLCLPPCGIFVWPVYLTWTKADLGFMGSETHSFVGRFTLIKLQTFKLKTGVIMRCFGMTKVDNYHKYYKFTKNNMICAFIPLRYFFAWLPTYQILFLHHYWHCRIFSYYDVICGCNAEWNKTTLKHRK